MLLQQGYVTEHKARCQYYRDSPGKVGTGNAKKEIECLKKKMRENTKNKLDLPHNVMSLKTSSWLFMELS